MIGVTSDLAHGLTGYDAARVGFGMVRFVLRWKDNQEQLAAWLHDQMANHLTLIAIHTSESRDPAGMGDGEAAHIWREWLDGIGVRPAYLQVGNEPDLQSDSSMTMSKDAYNHLLAEVCPVWRGHSTLVGGGLAGGDPAWLDGIDQVQLDQIALHPYGQRPDSDAKWRWALPSWSRPVREWVNGYRSHTLLPLAISEYGGRHEELREWWRDYYVEMTQTFLDMLFTGELSFASCFGLSELMVPGMGMLTPEKDLTDAGLGMQGLLLA